MPDVHISPHFTWDELTRTSHADLQAGNRNVPPALVQTAHALCWGILEPIRNQFGKPVVVHSGFRGADLNVKVGGSKRSQHMQFGACDFHIPGHTDEEVWKWVAKSGLPFGQVIWEPSWTHVSVGWPLYPKEKSGRVMTFDGTTYELIEKVGG